MCPNSSDLSLSPIVFPQSDVPYRFFLSPVAEWVTTGSDRGREKGKKKGFKGEKASALPDLGYLQVQ